MPQLLLELFCEEIPARMQAKAEADLGDALKKALKDAGLSHGELKTLSGPRRLTAIIDDVATRSEDVREERKGPKVGAPEKAVQGFMRGAGLSSIDDAEVRSDPKKGDFYVAVMETPGRDATDIIAEAVPSIVRGFHWPKSMRWGHGDLRWVRPLQRIVCVFDGDIVAFEIDGLSSGNLTEGHRVHGRGPYKVSNAADYVEQLENAGHVMLSREARLQKILADAQNVCSKAGLELVDDKGLLEEVAGLAEWPIVILGKMDPAFLDLPPEVIRLSMRTHQKYFAVRDPKTGKLAPNFVVVANIAAKDGGIAIAQGNSRVLSARLDDGRFFWDNDRNTPLQEMAKKLSTIEFKKELGSVADKVERVAALARELAPEVGADPNLAETAAHLCKADLVSEMVYEFPELQGVMGRYYAQQQNEDESVADAIRDHYKPQGPSDEVPGNPVSIAVALADKIDTLVGFWAIDEKPTGSKDPFALRRAALGVVRIILENNVTLPLSSVYSFANEQFSNQPLKAAETKESLLAFFADRLKVHLRDQGVRHDLIDGVFALGEDDLLLITKRVEALQSFLSTEEGANLLTGYKRAANILRAEEKKDGKTHDSAIKVELLLEEPEKALYNALQSGEVEAQKALTAEDFEAAMSVLSALRGPIDAFFDDVTVNAEDNDLRTNRLALLGRIRSVLGQVADFSKIEG